MPVGDTVTAIHETASIEERLDAVGRLIAGCLAHTSLQQIVSAHQRLFLNGKMLRSRLALRVGPANGVPERTLLHAAAAVEMIHSASLLHDDVIDGGYLRRGAPSFWVERGIPGAILLGDLLLFKAMDLVLDVDDPRLIPSLVRLTGMVCEAESEQELVLRGRPTELRDWLRIARRKTGALFAFLGCACGGDDPTLRDTLQECGFSIGTAYQLSDDILDAAEDPDAADKTLGSDQARSKNTVACTVDAREAATNLIQELRAKASASLQPWPVVRSAWDRYVEQDVWPAIQKNIVSGKPANARLSAE